VAPYAEEYRRLGADEALLQELADLTGGARLGDPKEAFTRDRRRSRVPTPLWPWLIGLVTLALVPEIALHRLGPRLLPGPRRSGPPSREADGQSTPAPPRLP
jgi:hypothetical protein